jgi:cytochrome P450
MSMTFNDVLFDPSLFPNPHTFDPARWARAAAAGARLDRYMVAFGKGSRSCLGLHLATAEMYLCLAAVLSRFDLRMEEGFDWERDMKPVRDCFVGMPCKESRGARVKLSVRER